MPVVADEEHIKAARTIREVMAAYHEHRDLISIGAYRSGRNPLVDTAIAMQDPINGFLRQDIDEVSSLESSREALLRLAALCNSTRASASVQMVGEPADVNQPADRNNPTNGNASP
jgi:hypothetical protein